MSTVTTTTTMNGEVNGCDFQEWLTKYDSDLLDANCEKDKLYKEGLDAYEKFGDSNVTLLWRLARAGYQVSCEFERQGDKANQVKLLRESEKWAKLALDKDPHTAGTHKWYAAICGKLTSFVGNKERIEKAKLIQVHLEEAMKYDPSDAGLYYSYGRWCIEIAKLSWIEKKIASAVFTTVPDATYEDAIKQFKKADELRPNWKTPHYYIGYCYAQLKDYKEAIKYLDMAAEYPVKDEDDKVIETEVTSLQTKYAKYR